MSEFNITELRRRMDGAMQVLKDEFGGLRTGRASVNMLEPVQVEAYGSRMPINQVGNVSVPEPRLLTVQVWDAGLAKAVEKAIREAGLGLNPQPDGTLIRVPVPGPSECAESRPPIARTSECTTKSPSPVPRRARTASSSTR